MKDKILNNPVVKRFAALLTLTVSFIIFQGQYKGHIFNDDDPTIEQPTLESFLSNMNNNNNHTPSTVTINDYDNFDIGIDFWEQNATTNPNNALWFFFGANSSSGQNARGTTNGGLNWYLSNPMYHPSICCDPWTSYTGSGVLIYGSGVNGQYIYRSTDNGLTWSLPVLSVSGNDRNHVSAEYTGLGPYANYVYAGITPGNFGRSTDAGITWTTTFTPSNTQPGCYIAVGPDGATDGGCVIYVTNTGTTAARTYNFYRSTNGGANFTTMSSQNFVGYIGSLNTAGRFVINGARTAPHPKIAMDNSNGPYRGRLYLVYATNDPPGNGNKPDVWLRYSTDQGATWSTQVRINDNADPQTSDQWFPEIYCERTTGNLYIHWYDDRNSPATFGTDVYATYTSNGGVSFVPNQRITNQTFTYPNPPCAPNTNCYRGDYTSIAANPNTAFSIWGDHRNGNALNMGAFFPDFAMRVTPNIDTLFGPVDSSFHYVSIPDVKLWNKTSKFSTTIIPPPSVGTITVTLHNKLTNAILDSLIAFPDSLRARIKITGGVPVGTYIVTVKGNGTNGTPVHVREINLTVSNPVGISNNQTLTDFNLSQNYPNPFNPSTVISYQLSVSSFASLKVYDLLGKEVVTLVNEKQNAGIYNYQLSTINYQLSSGIYSYSLFVNGNLFDTKRMILLK